MKVIAIMMVLSTSVVLGQSAVGGLEPADVVVLQQSWSNVIVPAVYEDPFAANDQVREAIRGEQEAAVRNSVRAREGKSREYSAPTKSGRTLPEQPASTRYSYRVRVKNAGLKTIQKIEWDYMFLQPDTLQEAGHRTFSHVVKIRPGKEAALSGLTGSPPIRVIDATKPVKGVNAGYAERIIIRRIEYADGSVWTRLAK